MRILFIAALAALAATAGCSPLETAGDLAIGAGQVVLGTADLLI